MWNHVMFYPIVKDEMQYEKANLLYEQGNYEEALALFKKFPDKKLSGPHLKKNIYKPVMKRIREEL